MNPYRKAVLFVLRLIASGCILISLIMVALYLFKIMLSEGKADNLAVIGRCLYLSIPMWIGLALLTTSSRIAGRLTQDFDE